MKDSRLLGIGYFAFITLGINVALLGPSLASLAARTQSTVPEVGYLFGALSLGYVASAPVISSISTKVSLRPLLSAVALILVSMFIFVEGRALWQLMVAGFVLGFGQSSMQVGYITLIGTRFNGRRDAGARMNRVNAFYGVGALVGPVLAGISFRLMGDPTPAFWVAFALDLVLLIIGLTLPLQPVTSGVQAPPQHDSVSAGALLRKPLVLGMVVLMGVYVGAEVAFSSWTTEFARLIGGVDLALAALSSSAFFAGMALVRYFANFLLQRVSLMQVLYVCIATAAAGVLLMLLSTGSLPLLLLGSAVVGAGYGPIYPTVAALAIASFPNAARTVNSVITSSGSLGAIFIPPLTGVVMATAGGPAIAWGMQLALIGVMLLILLAMRRSFSAAHAAPAPIGAPAARPPD
jgi:fucose permease